MGSPSMALEPVDCLSSKNAPIPVTNMISEPRIFASVSPGNSAVLLAMLMARTVPTQTGTTARSYRAWKMLPMTSF